MKKRRIRAAGFTLPGWDIIFVSPGFQPVDMWAFTAALKSENYDIINFDRPW